MRLSEESRGRKGRAMDLQDVTERDVGRGVVYRDRGTGQVEDGTLVSFNSVYLFVRYRGDTSSKATRPEDVEWLGT